MRKLLLSITTSFIPLVAVTSVVSCSPSIKELFFRNKDVINDITDLINQIDITEKNLRSFKKDIEEALNQYIETEQINEIRNFYVLDLYWTYSDNSKVKITQESFSQTQNFSQTNYVVKVDYEEKEALEWDSETEEFSVYNTPIEYNSETKIKFDWALENMYDRFDYETNESLFELEQEIIEEFSDNLAFQFKGENTNAPHQLMSGELVADYHINVDIENINNVKDIDPSKRYDVILSSGTGVNLGTDSLVLEGVRFRKDN